MSKTKQVYKQSSTEKDLEKLFDKGYSATEIRHFMEKHPDINWIEVTIKWERKIGEPNID